MGDIWDNVFKNGASKIFRRQPLKILQWYGLLRQTTSLQTFLRLSSTNFTWSILEYIDPTCYFFNLQAQMNPNVKHADPVFINFHPIPPPLGSWNGYSQVTLLHIFRTPLPKNTSGGLPLHEHFFLKLLNDIMASLLHRDVLDFIDSII